MADEPVASIEAPAKTVGSTWVHTYREKLFPVVIRDRDTVPQPFFELRSKDDRIPAILLGKHIYIWVSDETLEEYDPNYDYAAECEVFEQPDVQKDDSQGTREEKLRRMAFAVEAPELRDNEYWHNYILNESKVRRLERKMNSEQSKASGDCKIIGTKRSSQSSSNSPECSSDRPKRTKSSGHARSKQLLTPKSTPQGKLLNCTKIIEISDQEESDDEDSIFVRGSSKIQAPFTEDPSDGKHKRARGRPSSAHWAPPTMTDKECRILLGDNAQSVIVRRARCAESQYLKPLEHYDEERGEHIIDLNGEKRAVLLDLTNTELSSIWEYLWSGDFGPEYLKYPDDYQAFGKLSDAEKEKAAQKLAYAFVTASKVQLVPLQDMIEKKLNALYPLPPMALLIVALILTKTPPTKDHTDAQETVANWLIVSIASQFWELAKNHTGALQRLLRDNYDLRVAVYHKMQINADKGLVGCEEL